MFDVILSLSLSFAITFLSIPVIIRVSELKKLYDIPDSRKVHIVPIPSLGGLGIFAGFILAILISLPPGSSSEFQYFIAAAFIIFFLGIKDDILVISPLKKFIGQLIAAFIIVYKGGIQIKSMHGFLGIYEMPEMFSLLFTYFTIIVIINSFNLIDGVDGLAGSLAVIATSAFGLYFIAARQTDYAIFSFALSGSMLAFLIFNFSPARIFMGDTGSLLTGMVASILVIKFINSSDGNSAVPIQASPAIGFSVLAIPLIDTLRVFSIRMLNRRSPFSPDRNHVHHLLLDYGFSHRNIALILGGCTLLIMCLTWLLAPVLGCTFTMLSILALGYGAFSIAWYFKPKYRLYVNGNKKEKEELVVPERSLYIFTKEKLQ
jgi:UDP-GlcNAc:undecaprenyl-phosphate GlcNAc-1-phosphate transferase